MTIEGDDLRHHEIWSGVARYWYNKAADKSFLRLAPAISRRFSQAEYSQPEPAVLLYENSNLHYTADENSRKSTMALLNPILEDNEAVIHRCLPINMVFLTAVLRD